MDTVLSQDTLNATSTCASFLPQKCILLHRRQALDFMFTYFHLNYEQSLIPAGTTIQQLAAPAPGPTNAQNKSTWSMQSFAIDPAGALPSLQRVCSSFGCADLSPGQIPVYIGGYQLQVQQPFTAVGSCSHFAWMYNIELLLAHADLSSINALPVLQRDGTKYYIGDLLTSSIASINTTLLSSINTQRSNGGKYAKAGQLITSLKATSSNGGHTLIYMQSKPGSSIATSRQYQQGQLVIDQKAQMQAQSQVFGSAGQTQFLYHVQNPLSSAGGGAIKAPSFETVTLQEVLQFY